MLLLRGSTTSMPTIEMPAIMSVAGTFVIWRNANDVGVRGGNAGTARVTLLSRMKNLTSASRDARSALGTSVTLKSTRTFNMAARLCSDRKEQPGKKSKAGPDRAIC